MPDVGTIDLKNLSLDELDELQSRIEQAKLKPKGTRLVALIAALKETISEIRQIDDSALGEAINQVSPQALPKQAPIGKRYGLSETETKNAVDKGIKAVASI